MLNERGNLLLNTTILQFTIFLMNLSQNNQDNNRADRIPRHTYSDYILISPGFLNDRKSISLYSIIQSVGCHRHQEGHGFEYSILLKLPQQIKVDDYPCKLPLRINKTPLIRS